MKIRELPKTESPRKQLENEEYHANYQGPRTRKLEFHLKKQNKNNTTKKKKFKFLQRLKNLFVCFFFFFFFIFYFFNYKGFCVMFIQGKKGSSEVTSQVISE